MRRIIKIIVLFAVIYFVFGLIISKNNLLPSFTYQIYLEYSSIVGGIASILGLLTLGSPVVLTTKNLKKDEFELLRKLADLTETTEKYSNELDKLEQKKKETENLIWKACIAIALKERYSKNIDQLTTAYKENLGIEKRLRTLNEEVENNDNQELFKEIIMYIKKQTGYEQEDNTEEQEKESSLETLSNLFWVKPTIFGIGLDLNELFKRLLKNTKRMK